MAAAFGSATFVQPGIGRAHLAGVPGMPAINADTAYGPTFFATALTSTFFLAVAAAVLGTAIARTSTRLRWHGSAYAVLIPAFAPVGIRPATRTAVHGLRPRGRHSCARRPAAPHDAADPGADADDTPRSASKTTVTLN